MCAVHRNEGCLRRSAYDVYYRKSGANQKVARQGEIFLRLLTAAEPPALRRPLRAFTWNCLQATEIFDLAQNEVVPCPANSSLGRKSASVYSILKRSIIVRQSRRASRASKPPAASRFVSARLPITTKWLCPNSAQ